MTQRTVTKLAVEQSERQSYGFIVATVFVALVIFELGVLVGVWLVR